MRHCPNCGKAFKNASRVSRHLSQPRSSCYGWINDLVRIQDEVFPLDNHQEGEGEEPIVRQVYLREEKFTVNEDDAMDVDELPYGHEDAEVEEVGLETETHDSFEGAGHVYGQGTTFMNVFDRDEFAEARKVNLFYPFASRSEWEVGQWLLGSGLSMAAIDKFLSLRMIRTHSLSFRSAKQLRGLAEMLPAGPQWKCQRMKTTHPTKSKVYLYFRDPVECLESLFSNPLFHDKIDFIPRRVWTTSARLVRKYSEWMTGNAAWDYQSRLPQGATLLGTILSSDKTNISAMTGDRVAHPLLLGLANIRMNIRSKSSSHSFCLLALLPVPKFIHRKKRMCGVLEDRLNHECLDVILRPLKIAAQIGIMMADPVGNLRYCYTPIAAYIVDTPEARMVACVRDKTSPLTTATYLEFGDETPSPPRTGSLTLSQLAKLHTDPLSLEDYFNACEEYRLNGVAEPFWRDWPLACPSVFLTPEMLHHWHKEFGDHDLHWAIHVLTPAEIDFRMSVLQPVTGYRHFKEGVSRIKQVTGTEHRHIQRYFVAVIAGAAPQGVVTALRALMDFRYLGQAPCLDESHLTLMDNALSEFHANKNAIMIAEARRGKKKPIPHWRIPKLELMQSVTANIRKNGAPIQWTADTTEHAHIVVIKDPAKCTNNNNYDAQICRHLDRTEKCRRFEIATALRLTEDDSGSESDDTSTEGTRHLKNYFISARILQQRLDGNARSPQTFVANNTAVHLNHDPSLHHILIDEAAERFCIPDLRNALAEYLRRAHSDPDTYHPIGGQRKTRNATSLPFDHLQVWYKLRLQHHSYHDSSILTPAQTVNAMPPNNTWPEGRFDAVAVCTDGDHSWPHSGLRGHVVAELRLVMRPLSRQCTTPSWNDTHLMYVHRFDPIPQRDGILETATQMHVLKRATRADGSLLGDIIPLSQVRALLNIVPRFGSKADPGLTKDNSMRRSTTFFLNKYFTKDIYYALSNL